MDTLEAIVRAEPINTLTQDDKALIIAALGQLISLSRHKLTAQEVEGDHRTQLQSQIEQWQQLLLKLGGGLSTTSPTRG